MSSFASSASPTIALIADEDPHFRHRIQKMLLKRGNIFVAELETGISVWYQAAVTHPDLLILSTKLPLLDGLSIAKMIRYIKTTSTTKIVLVSEQGQRREKHPDPSVVDMFLSKPLSDEQLESALRQVLDQRQTYASS